MKFIHMADMHFDAPFVTLAGKGNLATERRLEQRKVMKEMVEYIKENNIPYFFIAGDLYEQDYIKKRGWTLGKKYSDRRKDAFEETAYLQMKKLASPN